jgi:hypothetical protein
MIGEAAIELWGPYGCRQFASALELPPFVELRRIDRPAGGREDERRRMQHLGKRAG